MRAMTTCSPIGFLASPRTHWFALLCLLALPMTADAQSKVTDKFQARVHESAKLGQKLNYRLLIPEGYAATSAAGQASPSAGQASPSAGQATDTYPLVLFLHGAGERGEDNQAQLKWGGPQLVTDLQKAGKCFVVAPQCPIGKQWVNTPWSKGSYSTEKVAISAELAMAIETVEKVAAEFRIDRSRFYVMGLSMGGFGTWDAITRRPDLFAAAVPICGGADPSAAEKVKPVRVWTFHGDADTAVPVSGTREMVAALRKAGATDETLKYDEYPGVGHNCWTKAWSTEGLWTWLLAQRSATAGK